MKVMSMRQKIFIVVASVIIIIGLIGGYSILRSDKKVEDKETKISNSGNENGSGSAHGSSAPVAKEQSSKPMRRSSTVSITRCDDVSENAIKTVLGSTFTMREAASDLALPFDVKVCEFTSGSKVLTVVIHDFGNEQIASTNQATLKKRSYSTDRSGTIVTAAKVVKDGKQDINAAQQVVTKLKSEL